MTAFELDPRLSGDSTPVCDLPLSSVRLMRDVRFEWLLLVPRRNGLVEIIDLDEADQQRLMREVALAGRVIKAETGCDKLNVAALGNMVPQLHVHVIARRKSDDAWPGPVWGAGQPRIRPDADQDALAARIAAAFSASLSR